MVRGLEAIRFLFRDDLKFEKRKSFDMSQIRSVRFAGYGERDP